MSSIMRRRSGLMGAWLMGTPGLEVRLLTPRSSSRDASPPNLTFRHQRSAFAAHAACLRLARSAFVQWPTGESSHSVASMPAFWGTPDEIFRADRTDGNVENVQGF